MPFLTWYFLVKGDFLVDRAKVVRADFVQNITDHWMTSSLVKNHLRF
jgi:hypothetical protein